MYYETKGQVPQSPNRGRLPSDTDREVRGLRRFATGKAHIYRYIDGKWYLGGIQVPAPRYWESLKDTHLQ